MKKLAKITAAVLTGALLSLSATTAFADGRGHDRHRYEGRGWEHRHHHHHRGPVVYAPVRHYAPAPVYYGPPRVVYQPDYYVPHAAPAISIGLSPIVIPLR